MLVTREVADGRAVAACERRLAEARRKEPRGRWELDGRGRLVRAIPPVDRGGGAGRQGTR